MTWFLLKWSLQPKKNDKKADLRQRINKPKLSFFPRKHSEFYQFSLTSSPALYSYPKYNQTIARAQTYCRYQFCPSRSYIRIKKLNSTSTKLQQDSKGEDSEMGRGFPKRFEKRAGSNGEVSQLYGSRGFSYRNMSVLIKAHSRHVQSVSIISQ